MTTVVRTIKTTYALYRLEYVTCGKQNCKRCPHGPYWYAYVNRAGDNGKIGMGAAPVKFAKYIGKVFRFLPGDRQHVIKTTEHESRTANMW